MNFDGKCVANSFAHVVHRFAIEVTAHLMVQVANEEGHVFNSNAGRFIVTTAQLSTLL